MKFVEANGLRFAYLEWGAGPLVVLLHGFPDTAQTWDRIGPEIAKAGYRVVAPFLRGYAPTGIPAIDTDSKTLGNDVASIIRELAADPAEKIRLVGHDWGVEASLAAAALAPELLSHLVTVAIPHRGIVTLTPSVLWTIRHFITLTVPGGEARFAANDYSGVEVLWKRWSPTWKYTKDELELVKNALAQPGSLHAAIGYYRSASLVMPRFLKRPIYIPSLAIAGADDPSVAPATFESARTMYRDRYSVATIPGGHFCHRESPQAFLDAVVPFLKS